ncbi:MAG: transposase [Phycisphaerae bacterium]|nr:transposase [Phycisphaerae bacterium]
MDDRRKQALRTRFDSRLRLCFVGAQGTSNGGLVPFRELDEAFRLTENASAALSDPRHGKNTQHKTLAMLRQAIYGRLAGYEDVNDAERLRVDPATRRVVDGRAKEKEAASTSGMDWDESVRDGDVEFEGEPDGADEPIRHVD